MDTGEPQRPSRVAARPGTSERPGAPADPRSEAPTGGTPRPRSSQPGKSGQARPRTAGAPQGKGSSGNGSSGNGAKAATKAKPGAPKKRPAPAPTPAPALPGAAARADAPPDSEPAPAAVAVVDTEHHAPSAAPAPAPEPTRPNGRIVTPPPLRSLPESPADRSLPAPGPIELPTIVPAEPDVPPHVAPATTAVPTVPVWPDGTGPDSTDTDGTAGLPSLRRSPRPARALRAPKVLPRPRRPRVRKVTRVVRHVDTWSVFKVALVFNAFVYAVCLVAGVLLWQVAQNTGTVDNVERFFETFGWESFELKGGEIYHAAWVAGLFIGVGGTGLIVLAATLFNLITDLVGGIRVTVLEEEVVVRDERGLGWRRARRHAVPPPDTDPDVATAHPGAPAPEQPAEQPG